MRFRTLLTVASTAALLVAGAPAAHAGTGTGNWCDDNNRQDFPIVRSPITVGIELYNPPGTFPQQQLRICFSDSPEGQPTKAIGGEIAIAIDADTRTANPAFWTRLECAPDLGTSGFWPTCNSPVFIRLATNEVAVNTPPSSICIISVGGGCAAFVPGVKVTGTNNPEFPLVTIDLLGITQTVEAPTCIAVVVTC